MLLGVRIPKERYDRRQEETRSEQPEDERPTEDDASPTPAWTTRRLPDAETSVEIEESEPGEPPAKRLRKEDAGRSEEATIGRHCRTVMQDPCIATQRR